MAGKWKKPDLKASEDEWVHEPQPSRLPSSVYQGMPHEANREVDLDYAEDNTLTRDEISAVHPDALRLARTADSQTQLALNPSVFGLSIKLRIAIRLQRISDWILHVINIERRQGNITNLAPLFFAFGIATYFMAGSEPSLAVLVSSALVFTIAAVKIEYRGLRYFLVVALALFCGGMSAAKLEVDRWQMPVPASDMTAKISGLILATDLNRRGAPRYVLRPTRIEGLGVDQLPKRVRLSASGKHTAFAPGQSGIGAGLSRRL